MTWLRTRCNSCNGNKIIKKAIMNWFGEVRYKSYSCKECDGKGYVDDIDILDPGQHHIPGGL